VLAQGFGRAVGIARRYGAKGQWIVLMDYFAKGEG